MLTSVVDKKNFLLFYK